MTFLPDPKVWTCLERQGVSSVLHEGVQDPAQITALLAMQKDLRVIESLAEKSGGAKEDSGRRGKGSGGKGNYKGAKGEGSPPEGRADGAGPR